MKKRILILFFLLLFSHAVGAEEYIKRPNVAGQFYSADPKELLGAIDASFSKATVAPQLQGIPLVICPHAGYAYSADVAAYSYKSLSGKAYKTVVIIGPSHFSRFDGFSVWTKGSFETPLGTVEVDNDFTGALMPLSDRFQFNPRAFEREHSLEVQIPFLQKALKGFKIVPILTGTPNLEDCRTLASSLKRVIGNRSDVLIVISTDMSHYHDDQTARQMDARTLKAVKDLDVDGLWNGNLLGMMELCGFPGVATALIYAKENNLTPAELKYANSGDVTGDKENVVGYCSVVFYNKMKEDMEKQQNQIAPLSRDQKKKLLRMARETITNHLQTGKTPDIEEADPRLAVFEGAFVTIHNKGQLRGCIGRIIGDQPLFLTVRDMAIAAATQDPRFNPVGKKEINDIDLEISVLSKPWPIRNVDELTPGIHGAIVRRGYHQGLFLPQVATEQGWGREEFLSYLCANKAGLPADCWKDPSTTIEIFTADVFSEKEITDQK